MAGLPLPNMIVITSPPSSPPNIHLDTSCPCHYCDCHLPDKVDLFSFWLSSTTPCDEIPDFAFLIVLSILISVYRLFDMGRSRSITCNTNHTHEVLSPMIFVFWNISNGSAMGSIIKAICNAVLLFMKIVILTKLPHAPLFAMAGFKLMW